MIKIYYQPQDCQGRVMHNIAKAVRDNAPVFVKWVQDYKQADVVIENIYGDHETVKARNNDEIMQHLKEKPYIILFHGFAIPKQYIPQNKFFNKYLRGAIAIYSAWDLNGYYDMHLDNFLRGPWGINEKDFFRTPGMQKQYTIAATGCVSDTEAIQSIYEAVKVTGGKMLHLGHNFGFDSKHYENRQNVSTEEVRLIFNSSKYVSALRRAEGFEIPAVEAGACGVTPICFKNPHYTDWFSDYAVFIEELTDLYVTDQLVKIFEVDPKPINEQQRLLIKEKFNWKTICHNMWQHFERRLHVRMPNM